MQKTRRVSLPGRMLAALCLCGCGCGWAMPALAEGATTVVKEAVKNGGNAATVASDASGIGMITSFFVFAVFSLLTAKWAAEKSHEDAECHPEPHTLNGLQNGLAIVGAYLSVEAFMGIPALTVHSGLAAAICLLGLFVGWPLISVLFSERLYCLGGYTFADFLASRFPDNRVRLFAALATLTLALFCLAAQLMGAGLLLCRLFDFEYQFSVYVASLLLLVYLGVKGLLATTWLQITKTLFLFCGLFAVALVITWEAVWRLEWLPNALPGALRDALFGLQTFMAGGDAPGITGITGITSAAESASRGDAAVTLTTTLPASFPTLPALSDPAILFLLGVALCLGSMGLPFILTRLPLASSAREARKSALWATLLTGAFLLMIGVISLSAGQAHRQGLAGMEENLIVFYLARVTGGEIIEGAFAAIAFVALTAVAAGLTRSAAAAVSYDIYARGFRRDKVDPRQERALTRLTPLFLFALAMLLAQMLAGRNLALVIAFVFSVAAASVTPALVMTLFWKRCTATGLVVGGMAGLVLSLVSAPFSPFLESPSLQQIVEKGADGGATVNAISDPFFFATLPGAFPILLAFFLIWFVSLLSQNKAAGSGVTQENRDERWRENWREFELRREIGVSRQ